MPAKIVIALERLMRSFLWKGNNETRGIHLINWKELLLIDNGRLGLYSLKDKNRALLVKWSWSYLKEDTLLWRKVVDAKYGSYQHNGNSGLLTTSSPKAYGELFRSSPL